MSTRLVDHVVRHLDESIRAAGFVRKSRTWNRRRADIVDAIDLQPSQCNESGNESFAMNFGVLPKSVYVACWQKPVPAVVKPDDCIIRRRLSDSFNPLIDEGQGEQWWTIHEARDVGPSASRLSELLVSRAIPFLDRLDSKTSINDALAKTAYGNQSMSADRLYLAILRAELGDHQEATTMLDEMTAAAPAWRSRVENVRIALGLKR